MRTCSYTSRHGLRNTYTIYDAQIVHYTAAAHASQQCINVTARGTITSSTRSGPVDAPVTLYKRFFSPPITWLPTTSTYVYMYMCVHRYLHAYDRDDRIYPVCYRADNILLYPCNVYNNNSYCIMRVCARARCGFAHVNKPAAPPTFAARHLVKYRLV